MIEDGPRGSHRIRAGRRRDQGLVRGRGAAVPDRHRGIVPDIITATSAGAIGAVVLAQARTLPEFAHRVQQMEDDILAMTRTGYVFGEQPWLRALRGTSLGGRDHGGPDRGHPPPAARAGVDRDRPDRSRTGSTQMRHRAKERRSAPGAAQGAPPGRAAKSSAWWPAPRSVCPGPGASSRPAGARS